MNMKNENTKLLDSLLRPLKPSKKIIKTTYLLTRFSSAGSIWSLVSVSPSRSSSSESSLEDWLVVCLAGTSCFFCVGGNAGKQSDPPSASLCAFKIQSPLPTMFQIQTWHWLWSTYRKCRDKLVQEKTIKWMHDFVAVIWQILFLRCHHTYNSSNQ